MNWSDIDPLGAATWNLFFPKQKKSVQKVPAFDGGAVQKGSPIRVVFGTVDIDDPFCAWWGDTRIRTVKVQGGGKK